MAQLKRTHRVAIALCAGLFGAGAITASAASMGELNVQNLSSTQAQITSCQDPDQRIDINWGLEADSKPTVANFVVSNLSKTCDGGQISVVINGKSGKSVDHASGIVKAGEFKSDAKVDPSDVTGVIVTITGKGADN